MSAETIWQLNQETLTPTATPTRKPTAYPTRRCVAISSVTPTAYQAFFDRLDIGYEYGLTRR